MNRQKNKNKDEIMVVDTQRWGLFDKNKNITSINNGTRWISTFDLVSLCKNGNAVMKQQNYLVS